VGNYTIEVVEDPQAPKKPRAVFVDYIY